MADFAKWVVACEPALPWKPGAFMREYLDSRQKAAEVSVENDPVAQALLRLIQSRQPPVWEGQAEELQAELNKRFDRPDSMKWPTTPASLGKWLRRAEPSLAAVGITLSECRKGGQGADPAIAGGVRTGPAEVTAMARTGGRLGCRTGADRKRFSCPISCPKARCWVRRG
jgi:hypothetical protein